MSLPSLLAPFGGVARPRPLWCAEALDRPVEEIGLSVEGARIEVLAWGDLGAPGVLLMHGTAAHARWWGPVAPLLAVSYRVASLSWSGMGGSDWRSAYSTRTMAVEALAAAGACGLFSRGPPLFVAHSFGGTAAALLSADHGERLAGVVFVDSMIRPVEIAPGALPNYQKRFYRSRADGLARFRFTPEETCENSYLIHDMASSALVETAQVGRGGLIQNCIVGLVP